MFNYIYIIYNLDERVVGNNLCSFSHLFEMAFLFFSFFVCFIIFLPQFNFPLVS